MKILIPLFVAFISFASVAVAQNQKDKIEIGVQTTSLSLFHPDFPGDDTQAGIGGRVGYNFNRSLAAEAEINFFPQRQFFLAANGRAIQAQFGIKAGKRFEKFGVFAKARPGFLTVGDRFTVTPNPPSFFKIERTTFFTMDIGGVLELYPSRRSVVRFEAGDTAIRHPAVFAFPFIGFPTTGTTTQLIRGAKFKHNFQFTAGVAFRLGDFPAADDDKIKPSVDQQQPTPRFEVGAQFTSLFVERPTPLCGGICLGDDAIHVEPGVGGRFTFNLTDNIALEAEGNYYTRDRVELPNPSGHIVQGQFGAKVGKRFDKWGVFGKGRPGFVGFTKVSELVRTRSIEFLGSTFEVGEFRVVKKFYPSIDVGGVVEFYISPRWMARFDIGDTIIRYGEIQGPGFSLSMAIARRPPETRHNLQVTSGIGFRF